MLDRIWAPWRAHYIHSAATELGRADECFLCRAVAGDQDRDNLVVYRGTNSVVVLNRYPYNNGHLLVSPCVHRSTLGELKGPELSEPIETVQRMMGILDRMLQPQGYNVGLNQGKAAGAGVAGGQRRAAGGLLPPADVRRDRLPQRQAFSRQWQDLAAGDIHPVQALN